MYMVQHLIARLVYRLIKEIGIVICKDIVILTNIKIAKK